MLPIVGVPATIRQGLAAYRDLFCRDEGFEHIGRYVTGLILSPHKTLQGIYDLQVDLLYVPPLRHVTSCCINRLHPASRIGMPM
jgi:hypothetical protein